MRPCKGRPTGPTGICHPTTLHLAYLAPMDLPVPITAARAWVALFRCQLKPVQALMPPPLEAVTMRGGRVPVIAFAIDCDDSPLGKFKHVGVGFAARCKPWFNPSLAALWFERKAEDFGWWMQFSAVSGSDDAVAAHAQTWGLPAFRADIDVQIKRARMKATVVEKGVEILKFEMKRPGEDMPLRFPMRTYGRIDADVVRTDMTVDAVGRERSIFISSGLTFRRHERIEDVRGVSIETNDPLEVRWYDSYRTRMDAPSARFRVK